MTIVLLVVLFGLVLSVLAVAVAPAKMWVRHQFVDGVRAPAIKESPALDFDADLPASAVWTALDDQQLARFLKGSSTS